MPEIDEAVLSDLMRRATAGLHAPPGVAAGLVSLHRRRRNRGRRAGQRRQQPGPRPLPLLNRKLKQEEKATGHKFTAIPKASPLDNSTLVCEQAAYTLWSPLLSPALRSALYKVLAATPGVVVITRASTIPPNPYR